MSSRPSYAPTGLPTKVTIYEVGPRDGLQNESALVPTDVKAEFVRRLLAAGLPDRRGDQLRAPEVGAPARRRRRPDGAPRRGRARLPRPGPQRARPRPRARARRQAHRDLRLRDRDLRAEEPQPQPGRAVRDVRADRTPRPRRRARRPGLRLDVLRRPVGGRRAGRPGRRRRQAALRPRRQPAQPRRHHRRRHRRPRDRAGRGVPRRPGWARTSSRCTSTTPTARPSPTPTQRCRPASRRTTRAPAASAAAPTPRAPPATSRPRTWSGCCAAWASSAGSTSSRSSTPASGWRVTSAGPARRPSYARCQ